MLIGLAATLIGAERRRAEEDAAMVKLRLTPALARMGRGAAAADGGAATMSASPVARFTASPSGATAASFLIADDAADVGGGVYFDYEDVHGGGAKPKKEVVRVRSISHE